MQNHIFYNSNFEGLAQSQMLKFETGTGCSSENLPLFSALPDWQRIVAEFNITDISGSVTFKAVTAVSINGNLDLESVPAIKQDGTTPFVSPAITSAGRYIVALSREGVTNTVSNIGAVLGFYADVTGGSVGGSLSVLVSR